MSGSLSLRRNEREKEAARKGCIVVMPKPNELFLDIDDETSLALFHRHQKTLGDLVLGWRKDPSPSGKPGRYHVTVTLARDVLEPERILLQACLGSDRMRELLSYLRHAQGADIATCFFEHAPSSEDGNAGRSK